MTSNGYCLACESDRILPTRANTRARDFECESCGHPYELKSGLKPFGKKIVNGAFSSMIGRIEDESVSSFLLLRYSSFNITDLVAIHRSLVTREIIQERKPLSPSAMRAGWVGCNILLSCIPPEGRIPLIRNGVALPKRRSRALFSAIESLGKKSASSRSWSRSLLTCLHRLPVTTFTLKDAYSFEDELSLLYPENNTVRPKIRQQLQVLRDAGLVVFEKRGNLQSGLSSKRYWGGVVMTVDLKIDWFLNRYRCEYCFHAWDDAWSSMCDDACPVCDTTMTPFKCVDLSRVPNEVELDGAKCYLPLPLWPPDAARYIQSKWEG